MDGHSFASTHTHTIWTTSEKKTLTKTPDTIFLFPTSCAFFKMCFYVLQINILINTIIEVYVVFYLFRMKPFYDEVSWCKAICDSYCEAHPCLKAVIDPAVCSEESEIRKQILRCYILVFFILIVRAITSQSVSMSRLSQLKNVLTCCVIWIIWVLVNLCVCVCCQ